MVVPDGTSPFLSTISAGPSSLLPTSSTVDRRPRTSLSSKASNINTTVVTATHVSGVSSHKLSHGATAAVVLLPLILSSPLVPLDLARARPSQTHQKAFTPGGAKEAIRQFMAQRDSSAFSFGAIRVSSNIDADPVVAGEKLPRVSAEHLPPTSLGSGAGVARRLRAHANVPEGGRRTRAPACRTWSTRSPRAPSRRPLPITPPVPANERGQSVSPTGRVHTVNYPDSMNYAGAASYAEHDPNATYLSPATPTPGSAFPAAYNARADSACNATSFGGLTLTPNDIRRDIRRHMTLVMRNGSDSSSADATEEHHHYRCRGPCSRTLQRPRPARLALAAALVRSFFFSFFGPCHPCIRIYSTLPFCIPLLCPSAPLCSPSLGLPALPFPPFLSLDEIAALFHDIPAMIFAIPLFLFVFFPVHLSSPSSSTSFAIFLVCSFPPCWSSTSRARLTSSPPPPLPFPPSYLLPPHFNSSYIVIDTPGHPLPWSLSAPWLSCSFDPVVLPPTSVLPFSSMISSFHMPPAYNDAPPTATRSFMASCRCLHCSAILTLHLFDPFLPFRPCCARVAVLIAHVQANDVVMSPNAMLRA
ncbi:hypothetical protein B0H15DRAFT_952578 [Mycena belliarum]|uniref:Uncharacterized protein n=1 Tax=Mycena belliarum TaxID=1033014 RepID=A0AAD6TXX5_9AGAR|nr:hypothetical protein B0H15DRAFT_952578 [Mycena belliae]